MSTVDVYAKMVMDMDGGASAVDGRHSRCSPQRFSNMAARRDKRGPPCGHTKASANGYWYEDMPRPKKPPGVSR